MEVWPPAKAHELRSLPQLRAYIPNATTIRRRLPLSLEVNDPELAALTDETLRYHSFGAPTQHKLVKDTIYWARRYDKDYKTQTANNPQAMASLIGEVAVATSEFIAAQWLGNTSVKLALRHAPEDIEELATTYAQHPIFTAKKCRHYIATHVGEPHQTLKAITEYFEAARSQHAILQLSNQDIFEAATIDDMRQGNFEPLLEAEFSAYRPLSRDPEQALNQLREIRRSKTQTEMSIQPLGNYIHSLLITSPRILFTALGLGLQLQDLALFAEKYAIYADTHDYDSLTPEQICATAQEHLLETQAIAMFGIKPSVASRILFDHTPNYLNEFFTVANQKNVTTGRALSIIKKLYGDPLWQLYAVCTHRDDLAAEDSTLTPAQSLQLALNTIGGKKTAQEICSDLEQNLATCRLLFSDRLSDSYIKATYIESPSKCVENLTKAHVLVGELYLMYDDPCMPTGFLQELVEKTDKKTLTWRLLECTKIIRNIRREHTDWSDQQVWDATCQKLKRGAKYKKTSGRKSS